jgi:hypothetical protein
MTRVHFSILACVVAGLSIGCGEQQAEPWARAYPVTARAQLIGGPKAQANIGDIILENDRIRVAVNAQAIDWSGGGTNRWGGAIIDADIQRPENEATPARSGRDNLIQIMPAIDIKTFGVENLYGSGPIVYAPQDSVTVLETGEGGGPASVQVTGVQHELVSILKLFPSTLSTLPVKAQTIYRVTPGQNWVEMTTTFTLQNADRSDAKATKDIALRPLTADDNPVFSVLSGDLLGDGIFYGSALDIIGPGKFGFSASVYVETILKEGKSTISSPPLLDWSAAVSRDVGYGVVAPDGPISFPLLEDFLTLGFHKINVDGDAFAEPGDQYSYTRYFIVDEGDIAGVLDHVITLKGWASGTVSGRVFNEATGRAASGAQVLVFEHPRAADGTLLPVTAGATWDTLNATLAAGGYNAAKLVPYSRFRGDGRRTDRLLDGSFEGRLPVDATTGEGRYLLMAVGPGNTRGAVTPVVVGKDQTTTVAAPLPLTGTLRFRIDSLDQRGPGEPSRLTVIGLEGQGRPDPTIGQGFFPSGISQIVHTVNGRGEVTLPAGRYRLIATRGYEYSAGEAEVTIAPLQTAESILSIARVVDTRGWVAGDSHVHSEQSPDSAQTLVDRATAVMVEGLDWVVSTDHDWISNYQPFIDAVGGRRFVHYMPGAELSEFSYGHFNGFPLRYDQTDRAGGAVQWRNPSPTATLPDGSVISEYTPQDCFNALRAKGDGTRIAQAPLVVANHTQESFTGYFRSFGFDQYSATFSAPDILAFGNPVVYDGALLPADAQAHFTLDFDAMEVLNATSPNDFRTATVEETGEPGAALKPFFPTLVRTASESARITRGELAMKYAERGLLDDYFTMLAIGKRPAPMGVSDSHDVRGEIGKGRTYVQLSTDEPAFIDENELIANIKASKTIASMGPFVELWVDGQPIGADVTAKAGVVQIRVRAQAPAWMSLDRIEIFANGMLAGEIGRDSGTDPNAALPCNTTGLALAGEINGVRFDRTFACSVPVDTFFNVVAIGYRGMSPYITPNDFPGVQNVDALIMGLNDALAAWFGISDLLPPMTLIEPRHEFYPYAVTGAVWVDVDAQDKDGDGRLFDAPGFIPGKFDTAGGLFMRAGPALTPELQRGIAIAREKLTSLGLWHGGR